MNILKNLLYIIFLGEMPEKFFRGEQDANACVALNKDILNAGHVVDEWHVEEAIKSNNAVANTSQGSEQEEYNVIENDEDEDFVVDC